MERFSINKDSDENIAELVFEIFLSSNIQSITDLNLSYNSSWFKHPNSQEERSSNVELLIELIS